ncbi:MAG TPA: hypothetical protein VHY35_06370 [Stellaceae bacterium]|jgi:hypothetical protein|nr:hypothetical protein [Stellaceae bacterium]
MASNDTVLSIVVKLIDDASAAMQSMSTRMSSAVSGTSTSLEQLTKTGGTAKQWQDAYTASATDFINQQEKVTSATEEVTDTTEKSGKSFSGMVSTMLEYTVAWQGVAALENIVEGFFDSAIKNALDDEDAMAQLKVSVDNAGLSFNVLGPQIEAVAQQHVVLGFQVSETEQSMGKLILSTGNYNDALKLNQLAMDLARSKQIDLNSATQLVEQVMAGNTRALKEYGISLDSAATSAQALDMLQQQVQGSAEAAADTSSGKWRAVQTEWQELEGEIGAKLMPILDNLFNTFEQDMPQIKAVAEVVIGGITVAVEALAGDIELVVKYIDTVVSAARDLGAFLGNGTQGVIDMAKADNEAALQASGLTDQNQKLVDAYNKLHTSSQISIDDIRAGTVSSTVLKEAAKDLTAQTAATGSGFSDIANRIEGANTAMVSHADAVAKLGDTYDQMRQTAIMDLADLADSFQSKMATIEQSISQTEQKITDLTNSYNQSQADDTAKVADAIVASENKISDLKKQLAAATTTSQKQSLQDQLTAEQKNYDSSASFRQAHTSEMNTAEARASETDLQRTIDDYNQREQLAQTEYDAKLEMLDQEERDQEKAAKDEIKLTQEKVKSIGQAMQLGQQQFIALSNERVSLTTKEVDAEIDQFQRLGAAIGQIKSANPTSISKVALPKFASGGIVTSPTIGLIGEAGPEAIIPLSGMSSGSDLASLGPRDAAGGITVNIMGGYYLDQQASRDFADMIAKTLNQQLRLRSV